MTRGERRREGETKEVEERRRLERPLPKSRKHTVLRASMTMSYRSIQSAMFLSLMCMMCFPKAAHRRRSRSAMLQRCNAATFTFGFARPLPVLQRMRATA